MNPSREGVLFVLALEEPADKRAAWLDAECEGDSALRQRLDALLAAHEAPDELPSTPAVKATIKLEISDARDEAVGQTPGRHQLMERPGEGGCGVVNVAEQSVPVRRRVVAHRFYAWAAFAAFVIVFVGFARTFFLRFLFDLPPLPWVLIGHGVLMTGWFVLYFVQTALVRSHQVALHRRLGMLSVGYVVLVVISGLAVAIHAGARDVLVPGALTFMGGLFILMAVFAVLVAGALLLRHRRDYHERLMLLPLLSMISPGLFRIPAEVLGSFGFLQIGGFFGLFSIQLLLVYICVIWDAWRHRRLHPAFAAGGLLIVAENTPLIGLIVMSPAWLHFANWLVT